MHRRYRLYFFVLGAFAASEILARALGIRFASETLGTLYQYLDPEILRDDLGRGLYYLHAQPPLFNLGLGLVLKAFPESYELAFSLLFCAAALALLLGTAWLMRRLRVPDSVNGVLCLLFALSPNFLVYRHWLFYTLPVAALLVAGAISVYAFLRRGRGLALASFAAVAFALMMTRSVFHPLWLVVVLAAVFPFAARAERRRLLVAAIIPLALVNLWFLKNERLVGSYSGSTWLGLSLSKRWPLSQNEVAELKARGVIPRFWHRRPFREPAELAHYGFFQQGERAGDVHPALDDPYKTNGEPNFNHRDYVVISEAMLQGDLRLIQLYPRRFVQRVSTALLLFLQPGPNSVHFLVDYDFDRVHRYRDFLTRYLFLGGRVERPIRMLEPRPNLMLLWFPLLLLVGVRGLFEKRPEIRGLHAFLLVNVVWVTAVANLVEIGENDRMRWEIEPFLVIWLGYVLGGALRRSRPFSPSAEAGKA